jgi:transposase
MPSAHRRHAEWTPTRLMQEAVAIGPATVALVETVLTAKPHPEQGFRACLGILRLVRSYGAARVEAACQRGLEIGAASHGSVLSILRNNLDRTPRSEPMPDEPPVLHGNVRGGGYYH